MVEKFPICNGTGIIGLSGMESKNKTTPKQNNARGTFVYPNACCCEYKGPVQISENKFVDENGNEIIYIPPSKR